jgi:hypothetical protein
MIWFIWVVSLWLLYLALARRYRPQFAMGCVVPLAWLAPVWVQWTLLDSHRDTIIGTGLDVKLSLGTAALVSYCFFKKSTYPLTLAPCDIAMLGLLSVHCLSDVMQMGLKPIIVGRAYMEWWVPYVTGRVAFQYRSDIARYWLVVAPIAMVLATFAIIETSTDVNLYETWFGTRPTEGGMGISRRWGMTRACGPCLNPNYFGSLQLLLLGWSLYAFFRALYGRAPKIFFAAPIVSLLGVACCGQRATILGAACAFVALAYFRFPKIRLPLLATVGLVVLVLVIQREAVIETLEGWSGEDRIYRADVRVVVNEESKEFSNTRARLLILDAYGIAMRRAGLFGFGTEAITGFPINVPLGPQEADTLRKLRFVDNVYVLITLRFGYLGLACLLAAWLSAIFQLQVITDKYYRQSLGFLASSLAATLVALLPVVFTVWMPQDFGFAVVWTWGAASGLFVAHQTQGLQVDDT